MNILNLSAGQVILYTGIVYTARDAAHARISNCISKGEKLPFDLTNAAIYYAGPTPTKQGEIIGSCGPTTSARMDDYTPELLDNGLKIMIGKGKRSPEVVASIAKHKAIYLCAVGGAAAIVKKYVISNTLVAYEDLGTEAIRKLEIKDFPLLVAIDSNGNSIF